MVEWLDSLIAQVDPAAYVVLGLAAMIGARFIARKRTRRPV